jgi:hypothetical protein
MNNHSQGECDRRYTNDKKNLVSLIKELYPELRQKGKILVLYITRDVVALAIGT